MDNKYHISLESYEVKVINFMKIQDANQDIPINLDPNFKVMVEKEGSYEKEGLLLISIKNDYFKLELLTCGKFIDLNNKKIDNETLSQLIVPLLLPFSRSVVHNTLRDAGFYNQMLPIIDVKRSIGSDD